MCSRSLSIFDLDMQMKLAVKKTLSCISKRASHVFLALSEALILEWNANETLLCCKILLSDCTVSY